MVHFIWRALPERAILRHLRHRRRLRQKLSCRRKQVTEAVTLQTHQEAPRMAQILAQRTLQVMEQAILQTDQVMTRRRMRAVRPQ